MDATYAAEFMHKYLNWCLYTITFSDRWPEMDLTVWSISFLPGNIFFLSEIVDWR